MARVLVLAMVFSLVASFGTPAQADTPRSSYIVVYRDNVDTDAKTGELERTHGFATDFRYSYALRGFAARLSDAQLARLRADPLVAFIRPDRTFHISGYVPIAPGDNAPPGVKRIGAATTTTVSPASGVNVAVIDSGVDLAHPDLNVVSGKNCINPSQPARDDNGHGTHVAGSIAAKNNGSGVVGVAPGTKIYSVKVINAQGSGTDAQVICGIDWVTANASTLNIKVANMSLGGPGSDDGNCGATNFDALHAAVCRSVAAGVTYVVAAGNEGVDFAGDIPANYNEALTVTAMGDYDGLPGGLGTPSCADGFSGDDSSAWFSNFTSGGEASHTIAGPGVCINSTWMGKTYRTISGTSMATPHVAGAVALCINAGNVAGRCAGKTPAQIVQQMRADAAARTRSDPKFGFEGDPDHPVEGAYFGYLVWAGPVDSQPPVISDVHATGITHAAATIRWTTSEPADGQVEYGLTSSYGSSTSVTTTFVTSQAVDVSGLVPTTTYHYRVKSRDAWGNPTTSGDFTLTTTEPRADLALSGSATPEPLTVGDVLTYQLSLIDRGPVQSTGTTLSLQLPPEVSFQSAATSQGSCAFSAPTLSCALGTLPLGTVGQLQADHPAGYWRLGEAPGSSAAQDASGNALTGIYESGIVLGQVGAISGDTAASFPGGPAVVIPSAAGLDLRAAFSVEAWVRPSVSAQNGGIVEKTVGGTVNTQYSLFLEGGMAKLRGLTATGTLITVNGPTIALGSWSHLAGTFDGSTLRLYVNGSLVASGATAGALAGGAGPLLVGRLGSNIYFYSGLLDEVAVFAGALSAERVRAHYQGGAAVRVTVSASASGTPRATASAAASETDPDLSNNTLTLTSTVIGQRADLALSGSAAPEPLTVGDLLTYQLSLIDRGPVQSSGTTLTLQLPPEASFQSAATSQGSCAFSAPTLSCALGTLPLGTVGQLQADHPAGYWRLGEPAGSTAALDASGNALTGSYEAGITLGQVGAISGDTAAAFPGGPALVIPSAAGLDLRGALSVEAWVRPSVGSQNGGILEKTVGGTVNTQYSLFLEGGVAKLRGLTATGTLVSVVGPTLAVGSWSHLAGTFDGSTLRLYVNGALVASAAAGALAGGAGPLLVGRLGSNIYVYQGLLDEIAVFPGALSAERVRAHYQGGAAVRVTVSATASGTLRATASAAASESDPDLSNNTLTLTSTVVGP